MIKYCTKCGQELEGSVDYCHKCGCKQRYIVYCDINNDDHDTNNHNRNYINSVFSFDYFGIILDSFFMGDECLVSSVIIDEEKLYIYKDRYRINKMKDIQLKKVAKINTSFFESNVCLYLTIVFIVLFSSINGICLMIDNEISDWATLFGAVVPVVCLVVGSHTRIKLTLCDGQVVNIFSNSKTKAVQFKNKILQMKNGITDEITCAEIQNNKIDFAINANKFGW